MIGWQYWCAKFKILSFNPKKTGNFFGYFYYSIISIQFCYNVGSLWSDITSASNSMFETFEEGDVIPQPVTIASRFSNSVPRFF